MIIGPDRVALHIVLDAISRISGNTRSLKRGGRCSVRSDCRIQKVRRCHEDEKDSLVPLLQHLVQSWIL
jgi:hypothetical protein